MLGQEGKDAALPIIQSVLDAERMLLAALTDLRDIWPEVTDSLIQGVSSDLNAFRSQRRSNPI